MSAITDKGMQARPGAKDIWLTQPFKRGAGVFVGRITPAGERLFYFRYTDSRGGRPFWPIGAYHPKGKDGFTLAAAYAKACELSTLYQSGTKDLREHLTAEVQDRRNAADAARVQAAEAAELAALMAERRLTMRQLFEKWCSTELQPSTRADGTRMGRKDRGLYTRQQFERHVLPTLGAKPIDLVSRADLLALIDSQRAKGQVRTAAVLLSDLRQMLSFAVDRELLQVHPLAGVKKSRLVGAPVERNRVLSQEEVRALWRAMPSARLSERTAAAIWLLLATGARLGELMGSVWAESLPAEEPARQERIRELSSTADRAGVKLGWIDLPKRRWHLPTTKNERSHSIHLSDFAILHFQKLLALRERAPHNNDLCSWVFPARDASGPVCVKSLGKQLADRQRHSAPRLSGRSLSTEALRLSGGRWTAHDLRRTAGTMMASLGVSGDVIDECLNHVIESRVRRTYIHDRREADQAGAFDLLGGLLGRLTCSSAA